MEQEYQKLDTDPLVSDRINFYARIKGQNEKHIIHKIKFRNCTRKSINGDADIKGEGVDVFKKDTPPERMGKVC